MIARLRDVVRDFVDEMLGGSLEPFTAYLAEQKPRVDAAELARLKAAIAALEAAEQSTTETKEITE